MTGESLYPRDLIERLRAELDRLEAFASAASSGPWVVGSSFGAQNTRVFQQGSLIDSVGQAVFQAQVSNSPQCRENAAFIAANGPDVLLRTIQAHRSIVDAFTGAAEWADTLRAEDRHAEADIYASAAGTMFEAVRSLASIYFPESDAPQEGS